MPPAVTDVRAACAPPWTAAPTSTSRPPTSSPWPPNCSAGKRSRFTLSAPLRSLAKPSLGIDQPGVYPVLVNVNGTPDYGAPARLDNARFLLPVVGVPPDQRR